MFRRLLNIIKGSRVKPLSQIDNIEDLKKYEEWIKNRGCPAGHPGEPGVIKKGGK